MAFLVATNGMYEGGSDRLSTTLVKIDINIHDETVNMNHIHTATLKRAAAEKTGWNAFDDTKKIMFLYTASNYGATCLDNPIASLHEIMTQRAQ